MDKLSLSELYEANLSKILLLLNSDFSNDIIE